LRDPLFLDFDVLDHRRAHDRLGADRRVCLPQALE
jgi:hypothetical protein